MSLLVYSRTAGYRHASIPTAQDTIQDLGYNVTLSEDPAMFDNTTSLEQYEAIIFLSTSGEILDTPQQKYNLEQFLLDGGGMIGFHTATGSLYTTPFYGQAFGAWFAYHPEFQQATFEPLNDTHPSTRMLPDEWTFEEEVYNFDRSPLHTQNTELLLTVERDSYDDPNKDNADVQQGMPHPICWCRDGGVDLGGGDGTNGQNPDEGGIVEYGTFIMPGRMWYTALGHSSDIWQDDTFKQHVKGGIDWVLGIDEPYEPSSSDSSSAPEATMTGQMGDDDDSSSSALTTSSPFALLYTILLFAFLMPSLTRRA